MLNYLQNHLSELLLDAKVSLPAGSRESLVSADDEVVSVLEEVVMYTFQQTVYYLTKVGSCMILERLERNLSYNGLLSNMSSSFRRRVSNKCFNPPSSNDVCKIIMIV